MEKEVDKSFSLNILRHNFDFEEYKIFIEYVFKRITDNNNTRIIINKNDYENTIFLGEYVQKKDKILFLVFRTKYSIFNTELNTYLNKLMCIIKKSNVLIAIYNNFQSCWKLTYISHNNSMFTNSYIVGQGLSTNYIIKGFKNISNKENEIIENVQNIFSYKKYTNNFIRSYIKTSNDIFGLYLNDDFKNYIYNNKHIDEEFKKSKLTNIWSSKEELFINKMINGFILLKFILQKNKISKNLDNVYDVLKKEIGFDINFYNNIYDIIIFCINNGVDFYSKILCPLINNLYKNIDVNCILHYKDINISNNLFLLIENNFKDFSFNFYPNDIYNKYISINLDIMSVLLQLILKNDYKKYNGTYYTPKQIVKYMCNKSIMNVLFNSLENDRDAEEYEQIASKYYKDIIEKCTDESMLINIYDKLNLLKIVDLCVGSGEFIIEILDIIFNIKREIDKKINIDKFSFEKEILNIINNNIYAYDIEIYALLVTKLRLYFFSMSMVYKFDYILKNNNKYNKMYKSLNMKNIQLKNSLQLDNRYNNFFNIVVGNPPYVGEKGDKEYFHKITKSDFGKKYYCAKMDLFYYFFHKSLDILNIGGTVNFITTNYFLTANGAYKLRKDIYNRTKVIEIVNFNDVKLFNNALGQHNQITFLEKTKSNSNFLAKVLNLENDMFNKNKNLEDVLCLNNIRSFYYVNKDKLYDTDNYYIRISNIEDDISNVLNKISLGVLLSEYCNINQGLVSGADKLSFRHIKKYKCNGKIGEGIFVITSDDLVKLNMNEKELNIVKPFYKNSDIKKYKADLYTNKNILYLNKDIYNFNKLYPNLFNHLIKYKEILNDRREVKKESIKFYMLQWPRNEEIFKSEKIVCPQRSSTNIFAYNNYEWYSSADVYYITKKNPNVNLKYVLGILNSNLYYIWFYYKGKRKGDLLELYQTPLRQTPIIVDNKYKSKIIELVDKILLEKDYSKIVRYDKKINYLVYKIYKINKFEIEKIENFMEIKLHKKMSY